MTEPQYMGVYAKMKFPTPDPNRVYPKLVTIGGVRLLVQSAHEEALARAEDPTSVEGPNPIKEDLNAAIARIAQLEADLANALKNPAPQPVAAPAPVVVAQVKPPLGKAPVPTGAQIAAGLGKVGAVAAQPTGTAAAAPAPTTAA